MENGTNKITKARFEDEHCDTFVLIKHGAEDAAGSHYGTLSCLQPVLNLFLILSNEPISVSWVWGSYVFLVVYCQRESLSTQLSASSS